LKVIVSGFFTEFDDDELDNYTSRKISTKLEETINPRSWESVLKDKGIFYRYLTASGLPVPKLYAIFFRQIPGWKSDNQILAARHDWVRFFREIAADEFVIKPCRGAFGRGIKIFKKTAEGYKDIEGNSLNANDIYEFMRKDKDYNEFVIQERLYNHPETNRLNPSDFLQTVRVNTFIDNNGCFNVLFAFLKLIGGNNITDNFGDGYKGNMVSIINTENGQLGPGFISAPDGKGTIYFARNPKTKIKFKNFKLPLWSEVLSLARKAAYSFLPVRAIGWDMAITPDGVKIVEGNIWWNPLNRKKWKDIIEAELPYDL